MRRFFTLHFAWPLWCSVLLLAGALPLLWCVIPSVWLRLTALSFDVFSILLIVGTIHHLRLVDKLVNSSEYIPPEKRSLSLLARLNLLLDETTSSSRRKYSAVIADTRAEISALQSQINPHFLYNTLDAIRGQALVDNSTIIADMTEALSVLFRYSISREGTLATIQEELRSVEKYIMIQQFRFNHRLSYTKNIDSSLLNCLIPRLSLQPIIENAVFHGLEMHKDCGIITLQLYRTSKYMVIRVSDNGIGMSADQVVALNAKMRSRIDNATSFDKQGRYNGIALTNVNRRIWLTFGEIYGVHIFSMPGAGTDVEILLPLITSPDQLGSISEESL